MTQQRILVADDEADIRDVVALYLKREGFEAELVANGEVALEAIERNSPNLLILDIMMPKLSGLEVIHRLRGHSNIPVIMLTSRDEEVDKIVGLEVGAATMLNGFFRSWATVWAKAFNSPKNPFEKRRGVAVASGDDEGDTPPATGDNRRQLVLQGATL